MRQPSVPGRKKGTDPLYVAEDATTGLYLNLDGDKPRAVRFSESSRYPATLEGRLEFWRATLCDADRCAVRARAGRRAVMAKPKPKYGTKGYALQCLLSALRAWAKAKRALANARRERPGSNHWREETEDARLFGIVLGVSSTLSGVGAWTERCERLYHRHFARINGANVWRAAGRRGPWFEVRWDGNTRGKRATLAELARDNADAPDVGEWLSKARPGEVLTLGGGAAIRCDLLRLP